MIKIQEKCNGLFGGINARIIMMRRKIKPFRTAPAKRLWGESSNRVVGNDWDVKIFPTFLGFFLDNPFYLCYIISKKIFVSQDDSIIFSITSK